ncbi:MAG: FAD-dependent oxidoreductase, partial [Marinobacter sp.]
LGSELAIVRRWRVLDNLSDHNVPMLTQCEVTRIDRDQVHYIDKDQNPQSVAANSVVLAIGAGPDRSLADKLAQSGLSVTAIGDCEHLGYIEGALSGGTEAALAL